MTIPQTVLDLAAERKKATFNVERLTNLLDGGSAAQTARRRQIETIVANDPTGVFDNSNNIYMHRNERHVRALAKHVRMVELCRKLGIGDDHDGIIIADPDFSTMLRAIADDLPTSLHWVMFVPNIVSLCDEEQQAKWLPLVRDWKMIGCYAQTEIGHGSNVRALETTATFVKGDGSGDDDDGSWIINSPTLTSAKFWPGTLGRTANTAMVIARLIDGEGVDRGIHNFLVPLRRQDDHTLLPGVTTGDIGPKIGYNNMDNGFCQFDHVRIPRRNMAMRFAHVDRHGKYEKRAVSDAAAKIAYITMMQVRAYICNEAGIHLSMACCITIRYSAVRRQGYINNTGKGSSSSSGKPDELQVLDYKQQQHRLFPLLAASYSFFFTGKLVLKRLYAIERRIANGEKVLKTEVADIHASTSSLKSFTTMITADGIEDCRKACGGHGFLQASGLPELLTTYLQNPTVEGDNQMLPQQVIKVLLKLVQAVQMQEGLEHYDQCESRYLIPSLEAIMKAHSGEEDDAAALSLRCPAQSAQDFKKLDLLVETFRHVTARLLLEIAQSIQVNTMEHNMSLSQAWNEALVAMRRCSCAYAKLLHLTNFVQGIQQAEAEVSGSSSSIGPAEVQVLEDMARLVGLYWLEQDMGDVLEDGYVSATQAPWIRSNVLDLLAKIRPNAVALVDARDFSDFQLKSVLGKYDGDVYPALIASSRKDPLNQTEPGPGYHPHLKRLIAGGVGEYKGPISGTSSRL